MSCFVWPQLCDARIYVATTSEFPAYLSTQGTNGFRSGTQQRCPCVNPQPQINARCVYVRSTPNKIAGNPNNGSRQNPPICHDFHRVYVVVVSTPKAVPISLSIQYAWLAQPGRPGVGQRHRPAASLRGGPCVPCPGINWRSMQQQIRSASAATSVHQR